MTFALRWGDTARALQRTTTRFIRRGRHVIPATAILAGPVVEGCVALPSGCAYLTSGRLGGVCGEYRVCEQEEKENYYFSGKEGGDALDGNGNEEPFGWSHLGILW